MITNAVTGEVTSYEMSQGELFLRKERLTPMEWENLRRERNTLLSESDINVIMDRWEVYTEETKQAWRDYRQDLRDLPANTSDPFNVVWPAKPTE